MQCYQNQPKNASPVHVAPETKINKHYSKFVPIVLKEKKIWTESDDEFENNTPSHLKCNDVIMENNSLSENVECMRLKSFKCNSSDPFPIILRKKDRWTESDDEFENGITSSASNSKVFVSAIDSFSEIIEDDLNKCSSDENHNTVMKNNHLSSDDVDPHRKPLVFSAPLFQPFYVTNRKRRKSSDTEVFLNKNQPSRDKNGNAYSIYNKNKHFEENTNEKNAINFEQEKITTVQHTKIHTQPKMTFIQNGTFYHPVPIYISDIHRLEPCNDSNTTKMYGYFFRTLQFFGRAIPANRRSSSKSKNDEITYSVDDGTGSVLVHYAHSNKQKLRKY